MIEDLARADVSVRPAGPEHARQIAGLHARLFDPAWTEDTVRQLLASSTCTALIALGTEPEGALGFVISQTAVDEAEVLSIGVSTGHQRHGIGDRLLRGLVQSLKARGIDRLFLEVAAGNAAARALYIRQGFREIGRRKAYYRYADGRTDDALNLALEI